mgnify:CR=1 FL=1
MAKSKLSFKRNITDKLSVKGLLTDDQYIVYEDENGMEQRVKVSDLLNAFVNTDIDFTVQQKSDEDLDIIPAEDDVEAE